MDIPDIYKKEILILCCGNILFGDDGFGCEVAKYIEKNFKLPNDVYLTDAGTSAGEILFTIAISEKKPKKIIIVDAVDVGKRAGEVFTLDIEDIPKNKIADFSLHLFPSSNMLSFLKEKGVDIIIIACQIERMPETVTQGISDKLKNAIPVAAKFVLKNSTQTITPKT
ncbi:MAG: hydrogenase maturation protease [Candidatus Thermoplasmatota archaeon]